MVASVFASQQPAMSQRATIINTVPPVIGPPSPTVDSTFTVTNIGTWQYATSFTYEWFVNGDSVGETDPTFDPSSAGIPIAPADTVICEVTGHNRASRVTIPSNELTVV